MLSSLKGLFSLVTSRTTYILRVKSKGVTRGQEAFLVKESPHVPNLGKACQHYCGHKFDDNLDLMWCCSVSGRLIIESFLGSPESKLGLIWGREAGGNAPTDIWWGSAILGGILPLIPAGPGRFWGGPMEVEETLVDWGGLGATGCTMSWGNDGWEADRARASWLKALLGTGGRCVGLGTCCTRDNWEPEGAPGGLDPYWNVRPVVARGLWTGVFARAEARAKVEYWEPGGVWLWTTWKRRTMRGDWTAPEPTKVLPIWGQKLIATACWRVAMAELVEGWLEGANMPPWVEGVMDMALGLCMSPCLTSLTISRSYFTISWIISFSRLLKTPELRSCCTLCIRIEFFLPERYRLWSVIALSMHLRSYL